MTSKRGATAASTPLKVPADSTVDDPVNYHAPSSGALTVTVDDSVGYVAQPSRRPADRASSHACWWLPALSPAEAAHCQRPASPRTRSRCFFGRGERFEPAVIDGAALGRLEPREIRKCAVVACSRRRASIGEPAKRDWLRRSGGGLVLAAGPSWTPTCWPASSARNRRTPMPDSRPRVLAVTDLRHPHLPAFRPMTANLGQVRFDRAWRMSPEGWNVAATFTDRRRPSSGRRHRPCAPVHIGPGSPLERFSAAPGVRPVRIESVRFAAGTEGRPDWSFQAPADIEQTPGVHALPDGRQVVLNVDTRESFCRGSPPVSLRICSREWTTRGGPRSVRSRRRHARATAWPRPDAAGTGGGVGGGRVG
jgi:hypothetical protein